MAVVKDQCEHYFVLAGNGPVSNRGCQAILHGTTKIFEHGLGSCQYLLASFAKDHREELPRNVQPLELNFDRPRWSLRWWRHQLRRLMQIPDRRTDVLKTIRSHLGGCEALFSVGGDNYSIDFNFEIVERLVRILSHAKNAGVPVIIWGASIGPFSHNPRFEERMARHFSDIDLIIVREPISLRYLASLGVKRNVIMAPDPAFIIDRAQPFLSPGIQQVVDGAFIGLNLSPLLARYATRGDLHKWHTKASRIVSGLLREFDNPILLVPHVASSNSDSRMDDELFLSSIRNALTHREQSRVGIVSSKLSCENLKWLISKSDIFIGARTHSTIAAFSTGVPTISIAYSQKGWGINEAIFGHTRWVLSCEGITPDELVQKVATLREEKELVRAHLLETYSRFEKEAYDTVNHITKLLHC